MNEMGREEGLGSLTWVRLTRVCSLCDNFLSYTCMIVNVLS